MNKNISKEKDEIERRLQKIQIYFLRIFRLHYYGDIIIKLADGKVIGITEKCNTDLSDSNYLLLGE